MTSRPLRLAVYFLACGLAVRVAATPAADKDPKGAATVHPQRWPKLHPALARDLRLESRVEQLLSRLTPAEKVGQLVQADIGSITPDDLRHYPLGSILNGGNSSPRDDKLAAPSEWLMLADRFYDAAT
ncbi:MAG TPA: hypothetical protein VEQ14_05070, partial [Steroidobacteraceae bacterium]|nr:hypothetical protein [Steroidobacteraceae bacterium]